MKTVEAGLTRLKAIKMRQEPNIAAECTAHGQLEAEKAALEASKTAVREKLENHTKKVVKPYEKRINELLDIFNAGFQIRDQAWLPRRHRHGELPVRGCHQQHADRCRRW